MPLSSDVTAVHRTNPNGPDAVDEKHKPRRDWRDSVELRATLQGVQAPELQFLRSDFRSMAAPTLRAIDTVPQRHSNRPITVILRQLVEGHWWGDF
jgi:hypothetical protein